MVQRKEKMRFGPDSPTQKVFLECTSNFIIYGGGAKIWPIQ